MSRVLLNSNNVQQELVLKRNRNGNILVAISYKAVHKNCWCLSQHCRFCLKNVWQDVLEQAA